MPRPAHWVTKATALVFNRGGRATITGVPDPRQWPQIGIAHVPVAVVLAGLTRLV